MQRTKTKIPAMLLLCTISILPVYGQSVEPWDSHPAASASIFGLRININFGGDRGEYSVNGVPLQEENRQYMTCPSEGSCAVPVTIMIVAGVLVVAVLSKVSPDE